MINRLQVQNLSMSDSVSIVGDFMVNLYSNEIEIEYNQSTELEHRKNLGQFFTPYTIAKFMAKWVLGGREKIDSLLDPAIGLGILTRAVLEELGDRTCKITGYDIDQNILDKTQQLLANIIPNDHLNLMAQDYLLNDWENTYDAIICNPPYLKVHKIVREKVLQEFQQKYGLKLRHTTNIYTLFMLKSLHQLKDNGRCAYLIPSEFLNSDYGKNVKEFLLKNKSLKYIILFDFNTKIFDHAITTSSILLFEKDQDNAHNHLEFINIKNEEELVNLQENLSFYPQVIPQGNRVNYTSLDSQSKWRIYYQQVNSHKYKNLIKFSTYAKVSRGIATGSNEYFILNQTKVNNLQIPPDYLLACINRAHQVKSNFFTQTHFDELVKHDQPIYLLNAFNQDNEQVNNYINFGEQEGINERYLTKSRKPWYSLENRPPSPIWVGVFQRNKLRFIKNEVGIHNLTTFHCVYLRDSVTDKADVLFAYFLTSVAQEIFNDNRREYGGGLTKFEPNDLNNSHVIDLSVINQEDENKILGLYAEYRNSCLENKPNMALVNQLNEIFIDLLKS